MTVICYKDGKIASDSRTTVDNLIISDKTTKVTEGPGVIGGASGEAVDLIPLLEWIKSGADLDEIPSKNKGLAIVAYSRGRQPPKVIRVEETGYYEPNVGKGEFFTCGSGREVAIGAFEMGASAEEAVLAAIKYCTACGGKVQVVSL